MKFALIFGVAILTAIPPEVFAADESAADAKIIPDVLLTERHAKLCRVKVGETFPAAKLPLLNAPATELKSLYGKQATVVFVWGADDWMTRAALADLGKDIPRLFGNKPVSVVGIVTGQPAGAVGRVLAKTGAAFPQLLDTDGEAVARITDAVLPQVYVLNGKSDVAWFDIEYSEASRRELRQTLEALTADNP